MMKRKFTAIDLIIVSEDLSGIIAKRWCVFSSISLLPPETIDKLTMTTLAIHNFLWQGTSKTAYCPPTFLQSSSSSSDLW